MIVSVFIKLGVLTLLVLIGLFAKKTKVLNPDRVAGLSEMVMAITLPCAILSSANMPFNSENLLIILWILIGAAAYFSISLVLSRLVGKIVGMQEKHIPVFVMCCTFCNAAFVGFPVIAAFLPENGIFYGTFFTTVFNVFFFTFGESIASGQKKIQWKPLITNRNLWATILMVLLFFFQIPLPPVLGDTFAMVGAMSTPLSLIVIGAKMDDFPLRELFTQRRLYLVSLIRLLAFPAFAALVLKLLNAPQDAAIVLTVMVGMPVASLTVMATQKYGGETEFAAKSVLQSTLLFALTLPLMALVVNWLF